MIVGLEELAKKLVRVVRAQMRAIYKLFLMTILMNQKKDADDSLTRELK